MNRLTEDEIKKYECDSDKKTGVDKITRAMLESIDLDEVPNVLKRVGDIMYTSDGKVYKYDCFTPKAGTYAWCPSFGGSQILIAKNNRDLIFTHGRWFIII